MPDIFSSAARPSATRPGPPQFAFVQQPGVTFESAQRSGEIAVRIDQPVKPCAATVHPPIPADRVSSPQSRRPITQRSANALATVSEQQGAAVAEEAASLMRPWQAFKAEMHDHLSQGSYALAGDAILLRLITVQRFGRERLSRARRSTLKQLSRLPEPVASRCAIGLYRHVTTAHPLFQTYEIQAGSHHSRAVQGALGDLRADLIDFIMERRDGFL